MISSDLKKIGGRKVTSVLVIKYKKKNPQNYQVHVND